ncbi:MAG: hypothetical protein IJJ26_03710, partial [Victivallales bacterium]|nr:hypothetical protein [Victivallales bacterium]
MAFELVYTSAPSGIKLGSSGFCTVACTRGLSAVLLQKLEGLSAYKPCFPHYGANAWDNPVACVHYLLNDTGTTQHILSRICFNGVDHTQRSNKLASHIVLNEEEAKTAQGGPASLFLRPSLFKDEKWNIQLEHYDTPLTIPPTAAVEGKCSAWQEATGDAGWAGVLAESFHGPSRNNVYIVFDPLKHKKLERLVDEALSLLAPDERWQVAFNTYFVTLPPGLTCHWRFCIEGEAALTTARRSPNTLVIDLTKPLPEAKGGELVECARLGTRPTWSQAQPASNDTPERIPLQKEKLVVRVPDSKAKKQTTWTRKHSSGETETPIQNKPRKGKPGRAVAMFAVFLLLLAGLCGGVTWYLKYQQRERALRIARLHCVKIQSQLADFTDLANLPKALENPESLSPIKTGPISILKNMQKSIRENLEQVQQLQKQLQDDWSALQKVGADTEKTSISQLEASLAKA